LRALAVCRWFWQELRDIGDRLVHHPPFTEQLGQESLVLRFTAEDAVALAAD
jgi:hypothetical protein